MEAARVCSNPSSVCQNPNFISVSPSTKNLEKVVHLKGLSSNGIKAPEDCSLIGETVKAPLTIYATRPSDTYDRLPINSISCQNVIIRKKEQE